MALKKQSEYLNSDDNRLAVLSQNGDETAFNVLASRYLRKAYKSTNSSYIDSEDIMQEGMFGFLNAVRTFSEEKGVPFSAYANVCMRNSMNSAAGTLSKELPVEGDLDAVSELESGDDPLAQIIDTEHLNEVLSLCETTLSEVEKTVVFFVAGGVSYTEISEKLGIDIKAVDNAVQRARKKLKKAIK